MTSEVNQKHHIYGQYIIGTWNINGFYSVSNPDNMLFKCNVLKYMYFNILVIPEHHCMNDQIFKLDDFKIIQFNRKSEHSKHGSGGIAVAFHATLLHSHEIIGIFKGVDGQIAIKLKNVSNELRIGILGLYLSPDTFHYG